MIIPAVLFSPALRGMSAGPSLMFISLPKVFSAMGKAGTFVGLLFFVTTIFATLDVLYLCAGIYHRQLHGDLPQAARKTVPLLLTVIYLAASAVIALWLQYLLY